MNKWDKKSRFFDKSKLVMDYNGGESTHKIAKRIGVSQAVIARWLRNEGCVMKKVRKNCSKINNENFFENIDSEEKAYFLGMLMTDGCILDNRGKMKTAMVILKLHSTDIDVLKKFKHVIGYGGKITRSCGYVQIRIASNKMVGDLSRLGVVPRKTKITKAPEIRQDLERHFWRGAIDGDGCLSKYITKYGKIQYTLDLAGNYEFCAQFKKFSEQIILGDRKICDGKIVFDDWHVMRFKIQQSGKNDMTCELYNNASIFMDRKMNKYKNMVGGDL
jgi:hypothetical protein